MDAITVRIQTMEPASGLVTSGVTKPPSQLGYFQYENGVYPATALRSAIDALLARHLKLVGLIKHESRMPGRSHCDMDLEDIASGHRIAISEERATAAARCRLEQAGWAHDYTDALAAPSEASTD